MFGINDRRYSPNGIWHIKIQRPLWRFYCTVSHQTFLIPEKCTEFKFNSCLNAVASDLLTVERYNSCPAFKPFVLTQDGILPYSGYNISDPLQIGCYFSFCKSTVVADVISSAQDLK